MFSNTHCKLYVLITVCPQTFTLLCFVIIFITSVNLQAKFYSGILTAESTDRLTHTCIFTFSIMYLDFENFVPVLSSVITIL